MTGMQREPPTTAVLFSGGLDSAVLLAEEASRAEVLPIYVSSGLGGEGEERAAAEPLLRLPLFRGRPRPLIAVSAPVGDVSPPTHWAIRGEPPAYDTQDE